jgi:hypothetical protein
MHGAAPRWPGGGHVGIFLGVFWGSGRAGRVSPDPAHTRRGFSLICLPNDLAAFGSLGKSRKNLAEPADCSSPLRAFVHRAPAERLLGGGVATLAIFGFFLDFSGFSVAMLPGSAAFRNTGSSSCLPRCSGLGLLSEWLALWTPSAGPFYPLSLKQRAFLYCVTSAHRTGRAPTAGTGQRIEFLPSL